ncbi:hypothetical protein EJ03DRAFT_358118 [Teratosphaeria nubilosa]|uniref:PHD-type domain-containing protein n=1 Tax=Teratosphaeria nubilosa TaxID=161662 RepID=A0A6G1KUW1_9PEZI|nr:hypothetical protein EJ03DRAFT_358118 [Teratosphaeria nubilosa]
MSLWILDLPLRAPVRSLQEQENVPENTENTKEIMMEDSSEPARRESMLPGPERSDFEHAKLPLASSQGRSTQGCSTRQPSVSPLSPAVISDRAVTVSSPLSTVVMASRNLGPALQGADQDLRNASRQDLPMSAERTIPSATISTLDNDDILRAPAQAALRTSLPPASHPTHSPLHDEIRHHSLPPNLHSNPPHPSPIPPTSPGTFPRPHLATLFTKPLLTQTYTDPLPSGPRLPRISNFSLSPSVYRPRSHPFPVEEVGIVRCGSCGERVRAEERMQLVRCDVLGCGRWWHLDCVGMVEPPGRRVAWECPVCGGLNGVEEEEEEGEKGEERNWEDEEEDGNEECDAGEEENEVVVQEWMERKKRKLR